MSITTSIKPGDLKLDKWEQLMGSKWQNVETEISAYWLIRLAQKNRSWRDFTKKEIDDLSKHDFWFNRLTIMGDIIPNANETYSFTDYFIIECKRLLTE